MLTSRLSTLMEDLSRESSILAEKSNDLKKYKEELVSNYRLCLFYFMMHLFIYSNLSLKHDFIGKSRI